MRPISTKESVWGEGSEQSRREQKPPLLNNHRPAVPGDVEGQRGWWYMYHDGLNKQDYRFQARLRRL